MSNHYFNFKRFRIEQERCSMKVGTDGVLLGAWFPLEKGMNVLDVGTGTGLVALMAAQRGAGSVCAVDIDPEAVAQARENVEHSDWAGLIEVFCIDIAEYCPDVKYDAIVCNPPYFRDSLHSPYPGRNTARHDVTLNFETLARCAACLIKPEGLLSVILPCGAVNTFVGCAGTCGLYPVRRTDVVLSDGATPKRSMLALSKSGGPVVTDLLKMYDSTGKETDEYKELVRDFYLNF